MPQYSPGKSSSTRIEVRSPDPACNPYLALAGLIAAGLVGIEAALPLGPATEGDAYRADAAPEIPKTLRAAIETFRGSAMLRAAMGDPEWLGFSVEAYVYAALVYLTLCFAMSRYSRFLERTRRAG